MKTLYEIKEDISVKYGFTQDISDKFAEMYLFGIEVTKEAEPEAKSQYNYWLKKLKEAKEKKYGKQAIERLEGIVNKYREVFTILGIDLTNGLNPKTKTEAVLLHLKTLGNITSWEAIKEYGATRLSAIIYNLRKRGYKIDTVPVETRDRYGNKVTYAKYFLRNEKEGN